MSKLLILFIFLTGSLPVFAQNALGLAVHKHCDCLSIVEKTESTIQIKYLAPEYGACKQLIKDKLFNNETDILFHESDEYKKGLLKIEEKLPTTKSLYSVKNTDFVDYKTIGDKGFVCTQRRIQVWYKDEYKTKVNELKKDLEQEINVEVCEANDLFVSDIDSVNICRTNLRDLFIKYDKSIYKKCQKSFVTERLESGGGSDDCLTLESYKSIKQVSKSGYFYDLCYEKNNKDVDAALSCSKKLTESVLKAKNSKDNLECELTEKYNTEDSVSVCKNFFLTKSMSLVGDKKRKKLFDCLGEDASDASVKVCIGKTIKAVNSKEQGLLDEIQAMFCTEPKFNSSNKDKCLEDVILNNLNELDNIEGCENELDSEKKVDCQRIKLLEKLAGIKPDDSLVASSCWSNAESKSYDERIECQEKAAAMAKQVEACLGEGIPQTKRYTACLAGLKPEDMMLEYLAKYNRSKFPDRETEIKFCLEKDSPEREKCLVNLHTESSSDIIADQDCATQEDFNSCMRAKDPSWVPGKTSNVAGTTDTNPDKSKSTNSTGTDGRNSNTTTGAAVGSTVVVAGAGLLSNSSRGSSNSNTNIANLNSSTNMTSDKEKFNLFRNFKNMKFKRHPEHICQQIGKGATMRVVGTVASVITAGIVHAVVMAKYKKEKGQAKAFDHLKKAWIGVISGVAVKISFNLMARWIFKDTQAKAQTVLVAEKRVPVCRLADVPEKTKKQKKEESKELEFNNQEYDYYDDFNDGFYNESEDGQFRVFYRENESNIEQSIAMFSKLNSVEFEEVLKVSEFDLLLSELNSLDNIQKLDKEYPGLQNKINRTVSFIINKILIGESIAESDVDSSQYMQIAQIGLPMLLNNVAKDPEENEKIQKEAEEMKDSGNAIDITVREERASGEIVKKGEDYISYINSTVLPAINKQQEDANLSSSDEEEEGDEDS